MLPMLSRFLPRIFQKNERRKTLEKEHDCSTLDKGKCLTCKVLLLDDTELSISLKANSKGCALLEKVFVHLNLVEKEYFGLRFLDSTNQTHWLESAKSVSSQLKGVPLATLYFGVKFYAADPCKLNEEITRYQFFLQLKRDILQGRLPVNNELAAELAALGVQSYAGLRISAHRDSPDDIHSAVENENTGSAYFTTELGDYDPKRYSYGYISEFRFVPNQTEELEMHIMQLHRCMAGQVPAVAEYNFINKVKWLEMYGVDLHQVQGEGNVEYFLGLTPTGIVVYKNKSKVGNYFWPRISKITYKGKMFIVRVKDKNNEENTYAFECTSKQACKHLWKCCIEHHSFFRLTSASQSYHGNSKLIGLGSKNRFSGKSDRQVLADIGNRPEPKVMRTPSKRYSRRSSSMECNPSGFPPLRSSHSESTVPNITRLPDSPPKRHNGYASAPDSPRSTKSAPWESGHHRRGGMFTSGRESPLSVRSEKMFPRRQQSESESESGYKRRHHRSRMESDTESEASHRRHKRRSRIPADESGTESEADRRHRRRHRKSTENLTSAEQQWQDVQRRIRDGQPGLTSHRINGSLTSMASDPLSAKEKRRRRRSKSPGNKKPPEELAQHFKYIDPAQEGIPVDQMRDIPYTKVETNVELRKIKYSPHMRHRYKSSNRRSGEFSENGGSKTDVEEAPPPYSSGREDSNTTRRSCPSLHPSHQNFEQYQEPDPEETLRSPAKVQRNETHTAPIVKTKPVPMYSPPYSHPVTTDQMIGKTQKHYRDDSGLGIEQDNYTGTRCYYLTGPSNIGPELTMHSWVPDTLVYSHPAPPGHLPPEATYHQPTYMAPKPVYIEQVSSNPYGAVTMAHPMTLYGSPGNRDYAPAAPPRTVSLGLAYPDVPSPYNMNQPWTSSSSDSRQMNNNHYSHYHHNNSHHHNTSRPLDTSALTSHSEKMTEL